MFEAICYDELKPGTKYKIGTSTGIFVKETWITLDNTNDLYMEFKHVKIGNILTCRRFFSPFRIFETFVSQNPQWEMERRSVNIIVRRILGDDCFQW